MNNHKKIIVFSGKQFAGKDTVAKILLNEFKTFKRIGIADAIKMEYSKKTGLSLDEIEKNKSTYRQDLIDLGNLGRSINPDYWLNSIIEYKGNTIVTDIRVKHEYDLFKNHGAFSIRVEASPEIRSKRGTLSSSDDSTETELDNINDWDYVLYNEGSYEELIKNVSKLIELLKNKFNKDI